MNKDVYFFRRHARDVHIAHWYWTYLPFRRTAIDSGCGLTFKFSFFLVSLVVFSDAKIIALCLYHFAGHMRIYHTIKPCFNDFRFFKIHSNSAFIANFCWSSILRFAMFLFSIAESSLTYIFWFRPLKQLILIKDRQQFKSKPQAYLICIKFTAHRSSDT